MFNDSLGQLRLYRGYTLVDITRTNVVRADINNPQPRNQQRNWETLVQVLGLRAQLTVLGNPEVTTRELFPAYPGPQQVWTFKFGVEQDDVFSDGKDPFGLLISDCSNVPIITGLTETAKLVVPTFDAKDSKNIYFKVLDI